MLEKSELLFQNKGTDHGSAWKWYCDALQKLFEKHKNDLAMFVKNFSVHRWPKGSTSAISSGTTMPPPIASIAAMGDWSLGQVLDIY